MKNNMTRIWFDGSSSPHKKNGAGWGVFVERLNGIEENFSGALPNDYTNNQAELVALIKALLVAETCCDVNGELEKLIIFGDSRLVIDWYNTKLSFKSLKLLKILKLYGFFENCLYQVEVKWIPRRENKADFYAKMARGRLA